MHPLLQNFQVAQVLRILGPIGYVPFLFVWYSGEIVLKIVTCRKMGEMIGKNPSTNGEEIPLNS